MQTAHVVADFAIEHEEIFKAWQLGSNYMCCLETTESKIYQLIEKLVIFGIRHTVFREPDIGNQITAVAVEPLPKDQHKRFFKNLKLAKS